MKPVAGQPKVTACAGAADLEEGPHPSSTSVMSSSSKNVHLSSSCWGPSPADHILFVPTAEFWHGGAHIKDEKGDIVFTILREEKNGLVFPIYRATIADEYNEIIAVVVRCKRRRHMGLRDAYTIYSMTPIVPGQEPVPYVFKQKKVCDMYPVVSIYKSLTRNYVVTAFQDSSILMRHKDGFLFSALSFSPFCMILPICRRQFTFYKPGDNPRRFLILRNQEAAILSVAHGASPLMGVCIAYAVDRMNQSSC